MKIERFEDIEAWQLARELTRQVYRLTKKPHFALDYGLKHQIQEAAGSSMHNIAEGFDAETTAEFIRFLRYAKRSYTEVQSELYVAADEAYVSPAEFHGTYEQARRTRAAVRGFINYLKAYQLRQTTEPHHPRPPNPEPLNRAPPHREPHNPQPLHCEPPNREPVNPEPFNLEPPNREPLNPEPLNPLERKVPL